MTSRKRLQPPAPTVAHDRLRWLVRESTIRRVAVRLGYSERQLLRWLEGAMPRERAKRRMLEVLGLDVDGWAEHLDAEGVIQ